MQNAFIESFNGRFRDELLNELEFRTLDEARRFVEAGAINTTVKGAHKPLDWRTPRLL